jgi:hypothetical protein
LLHFGNPAFDGVDYLTGRVAVSSLISVSAPAFRRLLSALYDSDNGIHDVLISLDHLS